MSTYYGKVSVDREIADKGNTVTITTAADEGYVLNRLPVTDKDGKSVGYTKLESEKYTFKMPAGDVDIKATFAAAQSDGSCPRNETCPINPFYEMG